MEIPSVPAEYAPEGKNNTEDMSIDAVKCIVPGLSHILPIQIYNEIKISDPEDITQCDKEMKEKVCYIPPMIFQKQLYKNAGDL